MGSVFTGALLLTDLLSKLITSSDRLGGTLGEIGFENGLLNHEDAGESIAHYFIEVFFAFSDQAFLPLLELNRFG